MTIRRRTPKALAEAIANSSQTRPRTLKVPWRHPYRARHLVGLSHVALFIGGLHDGYLSAPFPSRTSSPEIHDDFGRTIPWSSYVCRWTLHAGFLETWIYGARLSSAAIRTRAEEFFAGEMRVEAKELRNLESALRRGKGLTPRQRLIFLSDQYAGLSGDQGVRP
jgi:hypothetical protein